MLRSCGLSVCLVAVLLMLVVTQTAAECPDDSPTAYSIISSIHMNLNDSGSVHFVRVKLMDCDYWYQYESTDVNAIALYHALLLTAFSTGREVRIFFHVGTTGNKMIDSIYIR